MQNTSRAGLAAIREREGLRLQAYRDGAGVLTIGYGHTSAAGPPRVTPDLVVTAADAETILARDLAVYERAVADGVEVALKAGEFDALVSLCYNIGPRNFRHSSVLRCLNAGDRAGAADAFLLWNRAGGRLLPGLSRRREAERRQFLADHPIPASTSPVARGSRVLAAIRRRLARP